ncbi:MAG: hypothetical protein V8T10_06180 [Merdibacter sp.]
MRRQLDDRGRRIIAYMPTWRGKVIDVRAAGADAAAAGDASRDR